MKEKRINTMKKAMINAVLGAMAGTMALGLSVSAFASEITIDDVKNIALEAAGRREEDVIFKQANEDMDDGRRVFEVDFFVPGEITDAQAHEIALKDAGLKANEVTFTKCAKEMDDGVLKFDVEMCTANGTEYSFDIRVSDGTIMERDIDFD